MTRKEANQIVGQAIFGTAWVGALTWLEHRLLAEYVTGGKTLSGSQVPNVIARNRNRPFWLKQPPDLEINRKASEAWDRAVKMLGQYEFVHAWLDEHSFADDDDEVERRALHSALAQGGFDISGITDEPPSVEARAVNSDTSHRRGRRPTRRQEVADAMRDALEKGQLTKKDLLEGGITEDSLATEFNASRTTIRAAKKNVLNCTELNSKQLRTRNN